MNRKKFLEITSGTLAAGLLHKITPQLIYDKNSINQDSPADPLSAADFQYERRYTGTRFGEIAYVERGTNNNAALFLHAFLLNGFQWRGALEQLSVYRRCIAPDFLGMGYTEVAGGQSVTPADQVEMLVAFMNELDISSADMTRRNSCFEREVKLAHSSRCTPFAQQGARANIRI